MDDPLLREFLAEAEDRIEALFSDIKSLRALHREGRARRKIIARIFRSVHTIKGSAAAAEFEIISEFAHELETLLDGVRLGRVAVDGSVIDALEDAAETLSLSLSAIARGEQPTLPQPLIERLQRLALTTSHQTTNDPLSSALASLPGDVAQHLREPERQQLREAIQEGAHLFLINTKFDLATFDEQFRNLSAVLTEVGEIISALPGVEASAPDRISFRIIYVTQEKHKDVERRVAPFNAIILSLLDEAEENAKSTLIENDKTEQESATGIVPAATTLTSLVRVPLDILDELVAATHELFTETEATLDLILLDGSAHPEQTEVEMRAARVRRLFVELEQKAIKLRMVTVAQMLERAARAGLLAARVAGKEVDIEIVGGGVRLDKSLADMMTDPLLHLVRNAVDHGIEPPAERQSAGKSERGHIRLEAVAEGSRVLLRVVDDGRGIEPERITRAAIERGIFAPGSHLTKEQSMRLIFRPGFSTAASISSVSGRGVGLDIVERAVEQVGGEIRLSSRPGEGATFEMRLPTKLAIIPSLIVHSASYRYCIDASHIVETGYISPSDIEEMDGSQAARWRDKVVPLVSLRTLLAQPRQEIAVGDQRIPVLISRIHRGWAHEHDDRTSERVAVAVDDWDERREVLVRGLGRHAAYWRGISGATELRDGTVALMLDLPRLLEMHL